MSAPGSSDVAPISIRRLLAISAATFLVVLLLLELIDPRWSAPLRRTPAPTPTSGLAARALAPLPTPRIRRAAASPVRPGPTASVSVPEAPPDSADPPSDGGEEIEPPVGPAFVTETGGRGARLRETPALGSPVLVVLREGAGVVLSGQEVEADGYRWVEVRAADGLSGWVVADFLAVPAATPGP